MRRPTTIRSLPLFALTLALGCGSSTEAPDAGTTGMDATTASDGGVRAFCPMLAAPACSRANACGTMDKDPSQPTCVACKKTNTSLCTFGACSMPDLLSAGDPYNISFDIVDVHDDGVSNSDIRVLEGRKRDALDGHALREQMCLDRFE